MSTQLIHGHGSFSAATTSRFLTVSEDDLDLLISTTEWLLDVAIAHRVPVPGPMHEELTATITRLKGQMERWR